MLEILQFVLGSFWRWLGTVVLLTVFCEAGVNFVRVLRGKGTT